MGKKWLRYGLIGNFTVYGIGFGFMSYLGWILYDIAENRSIKLDR